MTDLAYTIAQTDLSNATKEQLKNFVKAIRESWGKAIDLRKADAIALKQYLEDYLISQVVAPEAEVTPEPAELVAPEPKVDFEGIDSVIMQATPISCKHRDYQSSDVLEGAHSANYSDETEGNYWFTWWSNFEFAKRQLVGATKARKHVVVTPETERELSMLEELFYSAPPVPTQAVQPHRKQPTSPAIIGLCILTTIALIADLIASATAWAIRKVRDTRLVQKGFRAAASAINTRRPKARGFAGA